MPDNISKPKASVPESILVPDWNNVRQRRDLVEVARFRKEQPDSEHREEADKLYASLRGSELANMAAAPWKYSKQTVDDLLDLGVYSYEDLAGAGLITTESWEKLQIDRDYLPDMEEYQKTPQDLQETPKGTDVYFFGMPTAGKTSLLMGIAAANGQGFTLDMRSNGGPYAAALRQYAHAGIISGRTPGKFIATVSGNVIDETGSREYPFNIIEMSGEEFALRIAEAKETSMANITSSGLTPLLRNDNHKVFFIIVDASKPMVKVSYLDSEIDEDGEISKHVRSRYISQLDILDKFVTLISLPENREVMNHVDAIHFIVTKTDVIGEGQDRETKATELINKQYLSVVEQLRNYCRHTKRINRAYDYEPQIFTFSLGKFFLGDIFEYDSTDTLKIVDAIREASKAGKRYRWRKMVDSFNMLF